MKVLKDEVVCESVVTSATAAANQDLVCSKTVIFTKTQTGST